MTDVMLRIPVRSPDKGGFSWFKKLLKKRVHATPGVEIIFENADISDAAKNNYIGARLSIDPNKTRDAGVADSLEAFAQEFLSNTIAAMIDNTPPTSKEMTFSNFLDRNGGHYGIEVESLDNGQPQEWYARKIETQKIALGKLTDELKLYKDEHASGLMQITDLEKTIKTLEQRVNHLKKAHATAHDEFHATSLVDMLSDRVAYQQEQLDLLDIPTDVDVKDTELAEAARDYLREFFGSMFADIVASDLPDTVVYKHYDAEQKDFEEYIRNRGSLAYVEEMKLIWDKSGKERNGEIARLEEQEKELKPKIEAYEKKRAVACNRVRSAIQTYLDQQDTIGVLEKARVDAESIGLYEIDAVLNVTQHGEKYTVSLRAPVTKGMRDILEKHLSVAETDGAFTAYPDETQLLTYIGVVKTALIHLESHPIFSILGLNILEVNVPDYAVIESIDAVVADETSETMAASEDDPKQTSVTSFTKQLDDPQQLHKAEFETWGEALAREYLPHFAESKRGIAIDIYEHILTILAEGGKHTIKELREAVNPNVPEMAYRQCLEAMKPAFILDVDGQRPKLYGLAKDILDQINGENGNTKPVYDVSTPSAREDAILDYLSACDTVVAMADIAEGIGSTPVLCRPIVRSLEKAGKIRKEGVTRNTRYARND